MNQTKNYQTFFFTLRQLFKRLQPIHKKQFGLLLIFMLFASFIATVSAGIIALFAAAFTAPDQIMNSKYFVMARDVFDVDFLYTPKGLMVLLSVLMVLFVGLKNILDCVLFYFLACYSAAIEAHFGVVLFNGFIHMPYEWHLNRNSADLILALQWRSYVGQSFFNVALKSINDVFVVLFLISAVFLASPFIALVVFMISGVTAFLIYRKIHRLQEMEAEKCLVYSQSINRQVTKGIHGIKDVKVSGQTSFIDDFETDAYDVARIRGMRSFYGRLPIGLLETIGFAILSISIIFMLFFTASSNLEITAVISLLIVAAWRILPATSRIMTGFIAIRNIIPFVKRIMEYIEDIESKAVYPAEPVTGVSDPLDFKRDIQVQDINFIYHDRQVHVLHDISFHIKKGQTVGIVGCSGVGKSTLVDIIIGLLIPNKGRIVVDGNEVTEHNRYTWLKKLSYVSQSPYICDGSIAENIAFGIVPDRIDRDHVLECCRMAYMQDILSMLPQGIDTVIGERGMRLSGGQRQRVAIARALYTNPELMIFDEATSSLDSKSENAIQETIASLKGNKTLLVIAHRLKTVENCDSLIWLEDGRVKMFDTPDNVLCQYEESLR
ncbi:MAG: ABC transporter ATP-binding protein/permease [Candidatus Omnitrophica bacterium]|nr:ABC transporter ATP-binding protein/permease [Candidatus Omnitrophota bacterium]